MVLLRFLLNSVVFPLWLKGTRRSPALPKSWHSSSYNSVIIVISSEIVLFQPQGSFSWNMQIDIWTKTQEEPYAYFWSSFSFQVFNPTQKSFPASWKYDVCFLTSVRLLNSTQVNPPSALDMELPPGKAE